MEVKNSAWPIEELLPWSLRKVKKDLGVKISVVHGTENIDSISIYVCRRTRIQIQSQIRIQVFHEQKLKKCIAEKNKHGIFFFF